MMLDTYGAKEKGKGRVFRTIYGSVTASLPCIHDIHVEGLHMGQNL